jgi:hypothetical protein
MGLLGTSAVSIPVTGLLGPCNYGVPPSRSTVELGIFRKSSRDVLELHIDSETGDAGRWT